MSVSFVNFLAWVLLIHALQYNPGRFLVYRLLGASEHPPSGLFVFAARQKKCVFRWLNIYEDQTTFTS